MSDGIYSALSGAIARQRELDVVSNNLANANTASYRQDRVAFSSFLGPKQPQVASDALRFAGVSKVQTSQSPGSLKQTGNPFDLALQGDGYFAIETNQGIVYTRDGAFRLNADGVLSTANGDVVLGVGTNEGVHAEIIVPQDTKDIEILQDGVVRSGTRVFGQIALFQPSKQTEMRKMGDTLFQGPSVDNMSIPNTSDTTIVQGALERSNVNAVKEMNELITLTRAFEALQRVIHTYRDIDNTGAREIARKA